MQKIKVLFLSPEVVPFAKTGGLADVAGALPPALKRLGVEVRLILPYYRSIREGNFETYPILQNLQIPLGRETLSAVVREGRTSEDIPVYFIEREDLYDRPNLYGNPAGDYYDNLERFAFFSYAALKIAEAISFQPRVIHCHDWQTGLVPALLRGPFRSSPFFQSVSSVFTIHNLGYQGLFAVEKLPVIGLDPAEFFHPEGIEFWGKISLLKAGIVYSDAITTVSPTYAREIQTPEFGLGMEGILAHRRANLFGILNGVDYTVWDPAQDPHLPFRFSPENLKEKRQDKEALLRELGLVPALADRPLIGMISRLDTQKGVDLLVENLEKIFALDVGLVVLGTGQAHYQDALQRAAQAHPGRLGLKIGFDDALAHRIIAGVDIFLIPSRYEPCGLTQMYALKYGTVPVVRATGGLDDTIVHFDSKTAAGNGFKFGPYRVKAFLTAIQTAVRYFNQPNYWRQILANGMGADFSWNRSAREYLNLYQSLLKG